PDLEGIPDVVAEVNGEEITKEDFEQTYTNQFQSAAMQQQMTGEELDQEQMKKDILDGMISQRLFIQEVDNRDMSASEEEVDEIV
ncbi:SurA N-terminal domain-containing protein, partial [Salinicoccus roseus]